MLKGFLEWIGLKEKLHNVNTDPPLVKERDLRRLSSRLGRADEEDFRRVKETFWRLYK